MTEGLDVHEPEECSSKQHENEVQSRWQRLKQHPALKPVLCVGSIAALGAVTFLTLRSSEGPEQSDIRVSDVIPEFTGPDISATEEPVSRKSPAQHMVGGHPRTQHYGTGGAETKTVQIQPYQRGTMA